MRAVHVVRSGWTLVRWGIAAALAACAFAYVLSNLGPALAVSG